MDSLRDNFIFHISHFKLAKRLPRCGVGSVFLDTSICEACGRRPLGHREMARIRLFRPAKKRAIRHGGMVGGAHTTYFSVKAAPQAEE